MNSRPVAAGAVGHLHGPEALGADVPLPLAQAGAAGGLHGGVGGGQEVGVAQSGDEPHRRGDGHPLGGLGRRRAGRASSPREVGRPGRLSFAVGLT